MIAKLVQIGTYNYSVHGVHKPTNITGGHNIVRDKVTKIIPPYSSRVAIIDRKYTASWSNPDKFQTERSNKRRVLPVRKVSEFHTPTGCQMCVVKCSTHVAIDGLCTYIKQSGMFKPPNSRAAMLEEHFSIDLDFLYRFGYLLQFSLPPIPPESTIRQLPKDQSTLSSNLRCCSWNQMPGRSKTCGLLLVQYRGTCPIAGVKSSHPFVPLGHVVFFFYPSCCMRKQISLLELL